MEVQRRQLWPHGSDGEARAGLGETGQTSPQSLRQRQHPAWADLDDAQTTQRGSGQQGGAREGPRGV